MARRTWKRFDLASAMRGWEHVRYEVTEEPSPGYEGERYSYTPSLGIFHAVMGLHGDILVPKMDSHGDAGRRGRYRDLPKHLTSCWENRGTTSSSHFVTPVTVRRCGELAAVDVADRSPGACDRTESLPVRSRHDPFRAEREGLRQHRTSLG